MLKRFGLLVRLITGWVSGVQKGQNVDYVIFEWSLSDLASLLNGFIIYWVEYKTFRCNLVPFSKNITLHCTHCGQNISKYHFTISRKTQTQKSNMRNKTKIVVDDL